MNFGSFWDKVDLAECLILPLAGLVLRSRPSLWASTSALFAANLIMDRVAIQQFQSPSHIMALWHFTAVLIVAGFCNSRHSLTVGLFFAYMFLLDGLAIAGLLSDQPVNGLGFDFWNAQSTLHHLQFLVFIALYWSDRNDGGRGALHR